MCPQTRSVAVKRRPKKTMEGSSEIAAPRRVLDVFMISVQVRVVFA